MSWARPQDLNPFPLPPPAPPGRPPTAPPHHYKPSRSTPSFLLPLLATNVFRRALEKRTKKLCGISRHQMQIWYKGWWLEDESRTLFGHGVVDGATLYVINGCVPPPTSCSPPPASYHATCTPLCVSLQSLFLFSKALLSVSPSLSSLSAVRAHHLLLAHPKPQRVAHSGKSVATSSPCTREKRAKQRRARASSSDLGAENTSVQASVAATPTRTQVLAKVKASEKFKVTVDVSCIEEG